MIIDTKVYSALYRGDAHAVEALKDQDHIGVPLVVIAELRYGFMSGNKTDHNEAQFNKFLAQDVVDIIYPTLQTAQLYAELSTYCRRAGRALSHNDLWIAALAQESNQQLVTYDKDFGALASLLGDRLVILSNG